MNFLWNYIDFIVLGLCIIFTLINTVRMIRRAKVPVRKVPAFFLIFGATSIAAFMGFGHLFEISFHAGERIAEGVFVFDFRFYSLILMGLLLLSLSNRMLNAINDWLQGKESSSKSILKTVGLIVAVSAPTAVFTPIGYVPSIACTISLIFLPFTLKKQKKPTRTPLFVAYAKQ